MNNPEHVIKPPEGASEDAKLFEDAAVVEEHFPRSEDAIAEDEAQKERWLKRHFVKLSLGAFAVSTAVATAMNPGEMQHQVTEAAPWVATGIGASEAMWVGGAALMLSSAGRRIGNPFRIRSRWEEAKTGTVDSKAFKLGLHINTTGAVGTAGIVAAGAATTLPPETWPGAFGIAAADIAATAALRAPVFQAIKESKVAKGEKTKAPEVKVRKAVPGDIDRLADIDLLLFQRAYGQELPSKDEIVEMLEKRQSNNPDWMFVAELDGEVEGFVSAFQTNKPIEEFISWEESTANGTLDGKVDPRGRYVYVTNMTIKHEAVEAGAEEMLLANLFANAIEDGVEYGYFVSRMPHFRRWAEAELEKGNLNPEDLSGESLHSLADTYFNLKDGEGKRYDPQLRMYEGFGYKLKRLVADAFEDDASYDFGVVCKADVPPNDILKKAKPIRKALASSLRQLAKHPDALKKVF